MKESTIYEPNLVPQCEALCELTHFGKKFVILHLDSSALFEAIKCGVPESDLGVVVVKDADLLVADLLEQVFVRLYILGLLALAGVAAHQPGDPVQDVVLHAETPLVHGRRVQTQAVENARTVQTQAVRHELLRGRLGAVTEGVHKLGNAKGFSVALKVVVGL